LNKVQSSTLSLGQLQQLAHATSRITAFTFPNSIFKYITRIIAKKNYGRISLIILVCHSRA